MPRTVGTCPYAPMPAPTCRAGTRIRRRFTRNRPIARGLPPRADPTRIEDRSLWPASWRTVAVRPKTDLPYCTYLVNAGRGGRPEPEMTYGAALLPTDVTGPWFYALAACNFGGWARFPRGVTVYGLSSEALVPRAFDVGR